MTQIFALIIALYLFHLAPGGSTSSNGFVVYCPCMGRFGNQVEQLLGSISFARSLNRTLVLPPFIEYYPGKSEPVMVNFDKYFSTKYLNEYLPVITMENFMTEYAEKVWPKEQRKVFCWTPRKSLKGNNENSCNAKEGSPFRPFWDHFGIDFTEDIFFGKLIPYGFNVDNIQTRNMWLKKFPVSEFPVLSFVSPPASFPSVKKDWHLQQFLRWTFLMQNSADKFINETLTKPFVAIHLRNNIDWNGVCDLIENRSKSLFASAQCVGEHGEYGSLTKEMCAPSLPTILNDVEEAVRAINAKSIFVSSDRHHYLEEIRNKLSHLKVRVHQHSTNDPHISLIILGKSDHFIGNCISTFSSIVFRERLYSKADKKPSSFFAFKFKNDSKRNEL